MPTVHRLSRPFIELYYSLPVQLLVSQVANHRVMLAIWVVLFLLTGNGLMSEFGMAQLLLEPEYQQEVSFLAAFIVGLTVGLFILAYQVTSYILDGPRFAFIALQPSPFRVFAINNSILPVAYWLFYGWRFADFQLRSPLAERPSTLVLLSGLYLGGAVITLLALGYFTLTNKNAISMLGERFVQGLQNPMRMARRVKASLDQSLKVTVFISGSFGIRPVPVRMSGDTRPMMRVLNQNHANALLFMLSFLVLLATLGLMQDNAYFQVPAGATLLILFAFVILLVGAVAYWFRKIGPLVGIALVVVLVFLNRSQPFLGRHYVNGLNYDVPPATYSLETINASVNDSLVQADLAAGRAVLDKWLANYKARYGANAKPRLLVVGTTGGGLRSATWTVTCLQRLDSLLQGRLNDNLRLISGASGGMIGASYYRELLLLDAEKRYPTALPGRFDRQHINYVSADLLNAITFNVVANLFIPTPSLRNGQERMTRDRGYAFERQLGENTQLLKGRRLAHYAQPEQQALVPQLIFAPAVVNDGRQLVISAQPCSYLLQPMRYNGLYSNEISGVEFRRFFAAQNADSLYLTSAIRLSASFPFILPFAELPTEPVVEVMDAGVIDNFGVVLALRYLFAHREWIDANTAGVVYLQIRDSDRQRQVSGSREITLGQRLFGVVGGTYNTLAEAQDFGTDQMLHYAPSLFSVPFDVFELQYIPERTFEKASLNFHLTKREKEDIIGSIDNIENIETLEALRKLLRPAQHELSLVELLRLQRKVEEARPIEPRRQQSGQRRGKGN